MSNELATGHHQLIASGLRITDFAAENRPLDRSGIPDARPYLSLDPYMRSVIAGNHMGHGADPGDVIAGMVVACVKVTIQSGLWIPSTPSQWLATVQGSHSRGTCERAGRSQRPSLALLFWECRLTAWAGMVDLAKVRQGDVVVIPAAVGGVGAMAAQLAKRVGATTIAITSGDEKRRIALESLGYDHCIDRIDQDLEQALKQVAPDGVSVYFDLVGDPRHHVAQLSIGGVVPVLIKTTTATIKPRALTRVYGLPSERL